MRTRGVNLNGADFGRSYPGREWFDHVFPMNGEVDCSLAKGMSTFRIGFQWEAGAPGAVCLRRLMFLALAA